MASSSSSSPKWEHDVLLSFHGADLQKVFLSDVLEELRRKGINVSIGPELITQAIRGSRIALVMLSRDYASSSSCLNELVEITKCREELGQLVGPIFYDLDPSDVKNQTGEFGKLFTQTCQGQTKEDIERWRHALAEVAEISGYHRINWDDEGAMIKIIVTHISSILNIVTGSEAHIKPVFSPSKTYDEIAGEPSNNVSTPSSDSKGQGHMLYQVPMSYQYSNQAIYGYFKPKTAVDISNNFWYFPDINVSLSDICNLAWEAYIKKMDSEANVVQEIKSELSNYAPSSQFHNQVGMGAQMEKMKHTFKGSRPLPPNVLPGKSKKQENVLPGLRTSPDGVSSCGEDKSIDTCEVDAKEDDLMMKYKDLHEAELLKAYQNYTPSTSALQIHCNTPLSASERGFEQTSNGLLHAVYICCADTLQHSFASHLSMYFRRKAISAFVYTNETLDMIEGASAFVVVFSKNFLSSISCLKKLVGVLQCRRKSGQLVVPIFYGISLPDVAVEEHKSTEWLSEWSSELQELRELPGHHSREERSECKLMEEIVKDVYEKIFPTEQIGINSRLLEIEQLICKQPWGIRRIGIWGMPGIGKTTAAKAVFDQISGRYEASCFIKHFDKAFNEKGFHHLLEEHFGEILKELPRVGSSITRPSLPGDILSKKRTLVVLDDVHSPLAAKSFLQGFHWFGPGSLIIITSRDQNVFRHCQVSYVYEVQSLNENESLQLFSQYAFGKAIKEQNSLTLSMEVVDYANGNPSALSFYGKELKGKKLSEMETTFLKLKLRTPYKIHDLFKSSYESLDKREKDIFLDIACFFNGKNVEYVMQLLEGCGFSPHLGIGALVEKCLLSISENRINMHRIIQDFGREIINGETVQIERRRRLWETWTIKFLLEDEKFKENEYPGATCKRDLGTEVIEGIFLDTSSVLFDVKPDAFENMLNLRFLKIHSSSYAKHYGLGLPKGLESLPYELRLLHWEYYPLPSLPQDFDPCHLFEINMPYSQLKKLWSRPKNLEMLKIFRLCHSQELTEIDDIRNAHNVELIDLQGCTKLQILPAMSQLQHLRVVNLSGCREIKDFPEVSPNIEELHLQGTGIRKLQKSIVTLPQQAKLNQELYNLLTQFSGVSDALNVEKLTSLVKLNSSNQHLGKLVCLNMKDCYHLQSLPDLVDLESLEFLNISGCSKLEYIQGFPQNLKELYLAGTAIKELQELPQSLEVLNAHGCLSLKSIHFGFKELPRHCTFSNCFSLSDQVVSEYLKNALVYVQCTARDYQQLNKSLTFSFSVPSPAKREALFNLQPGYAVLIRLSPSWRSTLVGFAILVEASFPDNYHKATAFGFKCVYRWKDKEGHSHRLEKTFHCCTQGEDVQKLHKEHMFIFCDLALHPSTSTGKDPDILADLVVFEIFPVVENMNLVEEICTVTSCGVYIITAENEDDQDTSLTTSQPVLSLDPPEMLLLSDDDAEAVVWGLDEKDRNAFFYIACLLNDKETEFVAPFLASIELGLSSVIEVLADNSLICISTFGVIVPQNLRGTLAQRLLDQWFLSRGNSRRHSGNISDARHFLRSCSLCERLLGPQRDIYMYRDMAFCSFECREQRMAQDEKKEKGKPAKESVVAATGKDGKLQLRSCSRHFHVVI